MVKILDESQGNSNGGPTFRVNLNIILSGSKKMSPEEQGEAMPHQNVHVVIIEHDEGTIEELKAAISDMASEGTAVLVNATLPAKRFRTGSVGYGLQTVAEFE